MGYETWITDILAKVLVDEIDMGRTCNVHNQWFVRVAEPFRENEDVAGHSTRTVREIRLGNFRDRLAFVLQ